MAQTVIYSDNFDSLTSYAITGWGSQYTGIVPWQAGLPAQVGECMPPPSGAMSRNVGTNKVACIPDCGLIDYNNSNVFIYTPQIDLSTVSGAWLKYDSYFEGYTDGIDTEKATVEISLNGGTSWATIQTVPADLSVNSFKTRYIDLSPYNYLSNVKIGFRYSDKGGWMKGWAIDNVAVIVPARKDIALLSVTPVDQLLGYVTIGQSYTHQALVQNIGLDTVHSFRLKYRQGAGPVKTDNITGVTIPPFSTLTVTHNITDTVFAQGAFQVTMWVDMDSDAYHYNDTAYTFLNGAGFKPVKRVFIEDGEATWNGWSPRNMVYLHNVSTPDAPVSISSVHYDDPMTDTPYKDFLYNMHYDYVPYMLFDRRSGVLIDSFYNYLITQEKYFAFADISINASFHNDSLVVSGTVTPAVDMSGDYRLALVITEDGVQGTDADYDQANNYAGGASGVMGGYEALPNPVPAASMSYDHVARKISPSPTGNYGILPNTISYGDTYDYSMFTTVDPAWHPDKLKAIVILIHNDDSTILNCNEILVALNAGNISNNGMQVSLYPDPARDNANVRFNLLHDELVRITVTDMSGRTLYTDHRTKFFSGRNTVSIPIEGLQNGIYLVDVLFEDGRKTLKLEVIH
jgi:hypothetical protein